MSATPEKARKRVKRSPNYPYCGLADCVTKAARLYEANDDHFAGIEAIAQQLGYTKTSSSLGKVVGALGQFGLIEEKGKGLARQIKVSEAFLDIHLRGESSEEYKAAIQDAVLGPKIYKELWDKYEGKLPPQNESIRIYLLRERPDGVFNKGVVDGFISQFRADLTHAGLDGTAESIDNSVGTGSRGRPSVGDYVQWTNQGVDQFPEPRPVTGVSEDGQWAFVQGTETGLAMSELTISEPPSAESTPTPPRNPTFQQIVEDRPGVARERRTLDEGPVILEWPDDLSAESVQDFEYWVSGLIRSARRKAGMTTDDA